MINLIPPAAKKQIVREYWTRVISVWLFLFGSMLMVTAVLMVPSYVLVTAQLDAFDESNTVPVEDMQTFQSIKTEVETANAAAALLTTDPIIIPTHELVNTLEELSSAKVDIVSINIDRTRNEFNRVSVRGVAADRAALVTYQDAVIAHERFTTAELPLSNFAERSDITFTMAITVNTESNDK